MQEALQSIASGRSILFLGSGFSRTALNERHKQPMTGRQLAEYLATETNLPVDTELDDSAEAYVEQYGDAALISLLKSEFRIETVQSEHLELVKQPWMRIYTTNYDNLVEAAGDQLKKEIVPLTLDDDIYKSPTQGTQCVHLNGYIDSLSTQTLWSSFKLLETSYLTSSIAASPWASLLRDDINLATAAFFVGYSLDFDIDIKRVLFSSTGSRKKTYFIVGDNPGERTRRRIRKFGIDLKISLQEFANTLVKELHSTQRQNRPLSETNPPPYEIPTRTREFRDSDLLDLFLYGKHSPLEIAASTEENSKPYFLWRNQTETALDFITSLRRDVVVHSSLGNGKTLFLEGLKARAYQQGFSIFSPQNKTPSTEQDIQNILTVCPKPIFVFEDYQDHLEIIRFIALRRNENTRFVFTARTLIHDIECDDLLSALGQEDISEIGLDKLNHEELQWVSDLLTRYGLWGTRAGLSYTRKLTFLSKGCHREWHAILLSTLRSPTISNKFETLLRDIEANELHHNILLSCLILTTIQKDDLFRKLVDLWGVENLTSSSVRRDSALRELIDFQLGEVKLRSSIAAQFILKKLADPDKIVSVAIAMFKRASELRRVSDSQYYLMKNLTRFSTVQQILPGRRKNRSIIHFYESIKHLQHSNPHFWLQYAVACTVIKDFPRASIYFDNAYALAEKKQYDPYMINNHYARFLLVRAVEEEGPSEALSSFRKARKIILEQIRSGENRHYPFAVAGLFGNLFRHFEADLDSGEKAEIARAAGFVISRISKLPSRQQRHHNVRECQKSLQPVHEAANKSADP